MKINKYFLVFFLLWFCADFYAMKRPHPAPTMIQARVGFVPQDNIKNELFALLDNAKRQVLVAMYWLTDQTIVDKLIALKQRGVDVQIIFDETSGDPMPIVNKLLSANIVPILYPSDAAGGYLMHNKFVVIDNATVFTGSANFTAKAFNFGGKYYNHENIIIINSNEIAQRYASAFRDIEEQAYELLIALIADNDPKELSEADKLLIPRIFQKDRLRKMLQSSLQQFDQIQQSRLQSFFNLQQPIMPPAPSTLRPPSPIEMLTPKQEGFLRSRGIATEGMTKGQASTLIGKIMSGQTVQPTYSEQGYSKKARPISEYQARILRNEGYQTRGMTYGDAYELINELGQESD